MIKRMIIMLIIVGGILGGVFWFKSFQSAMMMKYMSSMGVPAQAVSTIVAESTEWQKTFEAVGSLRAARGVDIAPEVPGLVEKINFNSGDDVKAGDVILQLRAGSDNAKLNELQVAADLAKNVYERNRKQFKFKGVSQKTLDEDEAALKSALAQVDQQRILLNKKYIKAPFDGRLGIRSVDIGQYLTPGTPIVTLQTLDHLYLDFFLPQQALPQLKPGQKVTIRNDAWPDRVFAGKIAVINTKVDDSTRNVLVRAELDNTDHALLPGMYATVSINIGEAKKYITLPQTSVVYNPYGSTVYLVEDGGKDEKGQPKLTAKQTFITAGDTRGDQVAILKGVNEGDVVVTSGQIKLRNGSPLVVNNSVTPANDPNPAPSEH